MPSNAPASGEAISSRLTVAILIASCLLLLLQAVTLLSTRWVEDESWYAVTAHSLATTGELRVPIFPPNADTSRVDTRPPLSEILMALDFRVFGTSLYSAKLLSLLSGMACILLTWLLGRELGGPIIGLLGAVVLATDNFFFVATRTARPEAFTAALSLLGILVFVFAQRRESPGLAFLSGMIVAGATLAHVSGFAAALAIGVLSLIELRWSLIRNLRSWAFVAGFLVPALIFLAWCLSDATHRTEFINLWSGGEYHALSEIPWLESMRYSDFLGLSSLKVHLPVRFPMRIHIVLAIFLAAWVLYKWNRPLLKTILCLLLPAMVWWAYERNPTSRYIADGSPYISLLLAGGIVTLWRARPALRKFTLAGAVLVLLSQVGGNGLLLYSYRQADYIAVKNRLTSLIPPGSPTYGAITFWLALYDHPYFSWNRTPLQYALDHGARYLILNDRVLVNGSGLGADDWVSVRDTAAAFVKDHAVLVGTVPNPFYGDLEVYRVNSTP